MAAIELPIDNLERWTFEQLMALPESAWRFEIVDGGLHMAPPAGIPHEAVSSALQAILRGAAPPELRVLGPVAVDIEPTYLVPDVIVLSQQTVRRGADRARAAETILVAEVVSPGSVSADRILKPAKYAAAGIPHFWRVELRPELGLTAYTLPAGQDVYTEVGTWTAGQTAQLSAPFPVHIPVADLAPDR